MQPISLLTKGLISQKGEIINNYFFPFQISIDYGSKIIEVLLEDVNLLVEIEQEAVIVEAGQEDLTVEIETINVEVTI
jgi:hypothetical protein